jgi:hypothetical protein
MSNKYLYTKIRLELFWWLFTGLMVVMVYLPMAIHDIDFPYKYYNWAFIILAITITRLIFQLRHSFLAFNLVLKLLLMFASVVVFMQAYRGIGLLNIFNDERGYYFLFEHLPLDLRYRMAAYVNGQYFLFGIASMVAAIAFPIRLLISIFRVHNRGGE